MKKTKVVLAMVCAVLLVAASVMGTLAYLTATTNAVVNTFTLGKVKFGNAVSSGLDEAKVDENGKPQKKGEDGKYTNCTVTEAERVTANTYKLKPAHTYTKDPTIRVASDSEACYLFVKVENGITDIEDSTNSIAKQMDDLGWKAVSGYDGIYAYYTSKNADATLKSVNADENVTVFNTFTIAGTTNDTTLAKYQDAEIKVTAYGVQSEGWSTTDNAASIWAATFGASAETPAE